MLSAYIASTRIVDPGVMMSVSDDVLKTKWDTGLICIENV